MLLHIFLQVICRRVVFALLGRLAGKNSAAFWDTFSVDLSMEFPALFTGFRDRDESWRLNL